MTRFKRALMCLAWVCATTRAISSDVSTDVSPDWREVLALPPEPTGPNAWGRFLEIHASIGELSEEDERALEPLADARREAPSAEALSAAGAVLERIEGRIAEFELKPGENLTAPRLKQLEDERVGLLEIRHLARLRSWRLTLLWWQGERATAFREAVSLHEVGLSLCRGSTNLITSLTGVAVVGIATDRLRWMLAGPRLDANVIGREMPQLVGSDNDLTIGMAAAFRGEFQMWHQHFVDLPPSALGSAVFADFPREHWTGLTERYDDALFDRTGTSEVYGEALAKLVQRIEDGLPTPAAFFTSELESRMSRWGGDGEGFEAAIAHAATLADVGERDAAIKVALDAYPNPVGRMLLPLHVPTVDSVADTLRVSVASARLLPLLAVLRMRVARGEEVPECIDGLQGEIGAEFSLIDPFDGGAIRYDRERRAVWSIGRNRIDDGGEGDAGQFMLGADFLLRLRE